MTMWKEYWDDETFHYPLTQRKYKETRKENWLDELKTKGKTVLEVGCGRCWLTPALRCGDEKKYVCLDPEDFKGFIPQGTEFVQSPAEKTSFKSASFDIIYMLGVLQHTQDTDAVLSEMKRILRTGGFFIVSHYLKPTGLAHLKQFVVRFLRWFIKKTRWSYKAVKRFSKPAIYFNKSIFRWPARIVYWLPGKGYDDLEVWRENIDCYLAGTDQRYLASEELKSLLMKHRFKIAHFRPEAAMVIK